MVWVLLILAIAVLVVSIIYWEIALPILLVVAAGIIAYRIYAKRKEQEEEKRMEEESVRYEAQQAKEMVELISDFEKFDNLPKERQDERLELIKHHELFEWSWVKGWLKMPLSEKKKQVLSLLPEALLFSMQSNEVIQSIITEFDNLADSEHGYDNCIFFLKQEWNPNLDFSSIENMTLAEYVEKRRKNLSLDINPLCRYAARHLKGTGVGQIDCDDMIITRPCYLKAEIRSVNQRQRDGELYYDIENAQSIKLYVFEDTVEFMDSSHWSINIASILDIKVEANSYHVGNTGLYYMLSISCRNRGNIFLLCDAYSAAMIYAVIPQVRRGNIKGKTANPVIVGQQENIESCKEPDQRSVSNPAVLPWVGPDYLEGIAGMKVLVVGDCRCQDVSEWNEGYVADVIGNKFLTGNSEIPAYNILTNIGKALAGKVVSEDERNNLWNRLAFCNFFQEPVTNLRKVTEVQIASGQKAFLQVLEKYAPDRVIACEPLYGYLPNEGRQGPEVTLSSPWKDGKIYSAETWIYPLPYGKECKVMPIANPGGGFPWDYWHELIIEFFK